MNGCKCDLFCYTQDCGDCCSEYWSSDCAAAEERMVDDRCSEPNGR